MGAPSPYLTEFADASIEAVCRDLEAANATIAELRAEASQLREEASQLRDDLEAAQERCEELEQSEAKWRRRAKRLANPAPVAEPELQPEEPQPQPQPQPDLAARPTAEGVEFFTPAQVRFLLEAQGRVPGDAPADAPAEALPDAPAPQANKAILVAELEDSVSMDGPSVTLMYKRTRELLHDGIISVKRAREIRQRIAQIRNARARGNSR